MPATMYYDWARTFSYNADVTMVITARDRGKTYGIRMAAVDDFVRCGYRFVEIVRYKNELPEIMAGYFDKLALNEKFADLEFKTEGRKGYIRRQAADGEEDVPWETACYFVALSEAQNAKKRTYVDVRKIIFDEALIDTGLYLRYLPREWELLANVIDTVTRETGAGDSVRPHAYLLSNACDLTNPYFAAWRIDSIPPYGYTWHAGKTVLLHYEDPRENPIDRSVTTLAGRIAAGTDEGRTALGNEFVTARADDIEQKPSGARFWIGLVYMGAEFGIWIDWVEGFYYVTRKIPKDAGTVYALTRRDNTANRLIARRATPELRVIAQAYYDRILKFDTIATRENLLDALAAFGIR